MKCFRHIEVEAIGICKACNKGLCVECMHDTGNGLACKDICADEVNEVNAIIDRSKQIYSIGKKAPAITSGVMVYFMLAVLFGGWGIYEYFEAGRNFGFSLLMGAGMFVIGVYVYFKQKKLKLNC